MRPEPAPPTPRPEEGKPSPTPCAEGEVPGRAVRRTRIHNAARHYVRARHLPRDLGIRDRPDLPEPERTRAIVRSIGCRIHAFLREGWRYEPFAVRPLVLERLRIALAGELLNLGSLKRREAAQ